MQGARLLMWPVLRETKDAGSRAGLIRCLSHATAWHLGLESRHQAAGRTSEHRHVRDQAHVTEQRQWAVSAA